MVSDYPNMGQHFILGGEKNSLNFIDGDNCMSDAGDNDDNDGKKLFLCSSTSLFMSFHIFWFFSPSAVSIIRYCHIDSTLYTVYKEFSHLQ